MEQPGAAMKQRWGFLSPWCASLKRCIGYCLPENDDELWDVQRRRLEMGLSSRQERSRDKLRVLREAIALLAAVEHVDHDAWRYLLSKHCGVKLGKKGGEPYEEQIPVGLVLYVDLQAPDDQDIDPLCDDLLEFCGTRQCTEASRAFLDALGKIAALGGLNEAARVEIEVPIRVCFTARPSLESTGSVEPLERIVRAERMIRDEWRNYEQSRSVSDIPACPLRVTVVLEPLIADFSDFKISPVMAQTLELLVVDNVWFSRVRIWLNIKKLLRVDGLTAPKVFGQLVAAVFDSTQRSPQLANTAYASKLTPPSPLQLGTVHLTCDETLQECEIEALCSAMVANQTTKTLSIDFTDTTDELMTHWWKWLAYTFFSTRACERSSLKSLALLSLDSVKEEDALAFVNALVLRHPEETLFGCTRGLLDERDAYLADGAPIRWALASEGELDVVASRRQLVRTFSDDGVSAWVDALVPGFGRCRVQRQDLTFDVPSAEACAGGLTSLTIGISRSLWTTLEGFLDLLSVVGRRLEFLGLSNVTFEMEGILHCCPNLNELALYGGSVVDVRMDFSEYQAQHGELPTDLQFSRHDAAALAKEMADPTSAAAKCVRRLRVHLDRLWTATYDSPEAKPRVEAALKALLEMLETNRSLEYLDVTVPPDFFYENYNKFRTHHHAPIARPLELPATTKLALLSVTSLSTSKPAAARALLDQHVVSNIFRFAAPPVLRQVYFQKSSTYDKDDSIPI